MTGFARCGSRTSEGALVWELRSVNHRFLEAGLRLPDEFRALEPELRQRIGAVLARGKVDASLRFEADLAAGPGLVVDEALARAVYAAAQRVAEASGAAPLPSAAEVMRWPGVVGAARADQAALHAAASALLDQTLAELVAHREREGAKLVATIEERAVALRAAVSELRANAARLNQLLRERIAGRVAELGTKLDPERLEQEVVLLASKADVAEELDRLDAHLDELATTIARGGPIGRRLDFLLQEFNREANTLGSKAQDPATTRTSVEMKVLIEQMREQVQNLE